MSQPFFRKSRRGVTRQPWHAIEIGVVTRQLGEPVGLHHGDEQGVVAQQANLLARRDGLRIKLAGMLRI